MLKCLQAHATESIFKKSTVAFLFGEVFWRFEKCDEVLLCSSLSTGAFFSKITAMEKPGKVVESSLRKLVQDTGNMVGGRGI